MARHHWQAVRIALVSPPLLPVPPVRYGGVERIVGVLAEGLHERGHEVTVFAPGDSTAPGRLIATVPRGLWGAGFHPDPWPYYAATREAVIDASDQFDLIHNHMDQHGFEIARRCAVPVLSTLHGRTDVDPLRGVVESNPDLALIAISESQRSFVPSANWLATIHHGLPLDDAPLGEGRGTHLLFVGRLSKDKGVAETVEAARLAGRRLLVAAKALAPNEMLEFDEVIAPAVAEGIVQFIGEVDAAERDRLLGDAAATIMLSRWPEPFGLVAIESLAVGTPVIAQRSGALPEIVVDGMDGFVVDGPAEAAAAADRVAELDRSAIRQRALNRFSAQRMVDEYETTYRRALERSQGAHSATR